MNDKKLTVCIIVFFSVVVCCFFFSLSPPSLFRFAQTVNGFFIRPHVLCLFSRLEYSLSPFFSSLFILSLLVGLLFGGREDVYLFMFLFFVETAKICLSCSFHRLLCM